MGSIYINSLAHTFTANANTRMLEVPITDSKVSSYRKVKVVEIHI